MSSALPSPYDYLDHRRFLAEWFRAKKESNPRFSHRMFARRAAQKNPSLLLQVIEGRRNLTEATTAAFVQAMGLRAGEAQFFQLLVELDQAHNADARNEVWERICATRRFREARRVDLGAFEYLSNWMFPAVRELARRPDFHPDPHWIAQELQPSVSPAEAARALEVLVALGLLVEEDGALTVAEASVATPPEVSRLAVVNYHRGMLSLAAESIERFPGSERHLAAITVGVPAALLPVLKAEATAFLERMMHLCDAHPDDTDRIVQLNVQLFPLSKSRQEPT